MALTAAIVAACKWFVPSRRKPAAKREAEKTEVAKTPASKPRAAREFRDAERRQIQDRVTEAIQRAGGYGVWIKPAHHIAGVSADPPVEVLAVPWAFDAVLAAIKQEAAKDEILAEVRESGSRDQHRSFEVSLLPSEAQTRPRGDGWIGHWRLREVPRLYRAAIVIDDLGQNLDASRVLLAMPYPFTFSVLPELPHSVETAEAAHRAHREVMLHLPMEAGPGSTPSPGAETIRVGMRSGQIGRIIQADLSSVPYATGVNNHQGSRATADRALMNEVMAVLSERHLYFVDSRTTARSVALDAARTAGLPTFYRSVFLDDTETVGYTLGELGRLRRVVLQQGVALAIGHPHPTTLAALAQFLPELERDDIELVPASELVRLPEVARLSPPSKGQ